jgi:hypothetical protein
MGVRSRVMLSGGLQLASSRPTVSRERNVRVEVQSRLARGAFWLQVIVALAACREGPVALTVVSDSPALSRTVHDQNRLAQLREIGEGCAIIASDSIGVIRALPLPRNKLPFDIPAVVRGRENERGNGRIAHVAINETGERPIWLSCWVPNTLELGEIASAVGSSKTDTRWQDVLLRLKHAAEFPPQEQRTALSPEAAEFAMELLSPDSANPRQLGSNSSASVQLNPTGQSLNTWMSTSKRSGRRSTATLPLPSGQLSVPTTPRYDWAGDCTWGWGAYVYTMTGWGITCSYGGMGWEIQVSVYFYFDYWYDAYVWTIDNGYWQPYTWCTTRELSLIAWQYDDESLYNPTAFGNTNTPGNMPAQDRTTAHWKPQCSEFTQYAASHFFTWNDLKEHTSTAWAVVKDPLVIDTSAHYGLDYWRLQYGSARNVNSAYRTPIHNAFKGGRPGSSHMRGVAVDLRNETQQDWEYNAMANAAVLAQASFIEPLTGPCKHDCTHADWRWWVAWPH